MDLKLWYDKPAIEWEEALPIGNGRLGAMIFGDATKEHLQINEDTIWTGKPHDYAHKGAHKYLKEIRDLLTAGKQKEAEELATEEFMGVPVRQEAYQPFCDLFLNFTGINPEQVESYHRNLDLNDAISYVSFVHDGVKYEREYLASHPDQGIFVSCKADQPGMINFNLSLGSAHEDITVVATDAGLVLQGQVETDGIKFEGRAQIITDGGKVASVTQDGQAILQVTNANAATIIFVGASSFINYQDISADPGERCDKYVAGLVNRNYEQVKTDHIQDYQALFRTVTFDLEANLSDKPTDLRIKDFSYQSDDLKLVVLHYQYGRYLMIAGSRPGTTALNLQGIWNDKLNPPWGGKYTCNINIPMNYWPAEPGNLSICHQPLFDLLKVVYETGQVVAKEHYNSRGWVLHHNTDIWGGTAPVNFSNHGIWPTGGAWLTGHLWQHYLYHEDLDFLKEYYPIIRDAALFFVDNLVEDEATGWLISTPSNSPEIGGLVAGPTMDHQIIRELFNNCIEASELVGQDAELRSELKDLVGRIAPNQVGQHGQLQEWLTDLDDPSSKHRHVSHLWGLHPGKEISPHLDPKINAAAKQSLEFRGDHGTGWSMAWKINFWARFEDGDRSYKLLTDLISEGTYPNLFDAHPPFQIDGNFGAAAGVMEMLLQCHLDNIALLPSLPSSWSKGSIQGLLAIGGFEVDISWENCKLTFAKVISKLGKECRVRYQEPIVVYDSNNQLVPTQDLGNNIYAFATTSGAEYTIKVK